MIKEVPLVTIIITCYNYAQYVEQTLESVARQTYKNIETIIINDGSTDDSEQVIKRFLRKKNLNNARYIHQKNSGLVASRNHGIDLANGKYVIFLDADNYFDADYIAGCVKCALRNKADVVYCDLQNFDDNDILRIMPEYNLEILKNSNYIDGGSMFRKASLGDHRFDMGLNYRTHDDWDFFLGMGLRGAKIVRGGDGLKLNYRIHENHMNNDVNNAREHLKYVEVYKYIFDKYKTQYPKEMDYLFGNMVTGWYIEQNAELQAIRNSKSYKIGRVITYPMNVLRKIFHGRR